VKKIGALGAKGGVVGWTMFIDVRSWWVNLSNFVTRLFLRGNWMYFKFGFWVPIGRP